MAGITIALALLIAVHLCRNVGTVVPERRIVGGVEATPNEFPHVVLILIFRKGSIGMCGGSILTPEYILTAAHCVKDEPIPAIKNFAGGHNFKVPDDPAKPSAQAAEVDSFFVHECYERPEDVDLAKHNTNDIALIKLDNIFNFTRTVMPIQVDDSNRALPHTSVTIVGWGRTNPDPNVESSSAVLKKGKLVISEEGKCERRFPFLHKESQVCALPTDAFACLGDSGGSLICEQGDTRYVCGILSFVGDETCITSSSVYTRTSYFNKWIADIVKNGRQPALKCSKGVTKPRTIPTTTEESTTKGSTDNVGNCQSPFYEQYYVVTLILFTRF